MLNSISHQAPPKGHFQPPFRVPFSPSHLCCILTVWRKDCGSHFNDELPSALTGCINAVISQGKISLAMSFARICQWQPFEHTKHDATSMISCANEHPEVATLIQGVQISAQLICNALASTCAKAKTLLLQKHLLPHALDAVCDKCPSAVSAYPYKA